MAEYLRPGVYIEEVPTGTQSIPGVSTSLPCDGEEESLERPSYFVGMRLDAEDRRSEQEYQLGKLRPAQPSPARMGRRVGIVVAAKPERRPTFAFTHRARVRTLPDG